MAKSRTKLINNPYWPKILAIICCVFCSASSAQDLLSMLPREWTSASGKFKVEATYIGAEAGNVTLQRADNGKEITIPVKKLCRADQKFVNNMVKQLDRPAELTQPAPPKPRAPRQPVDTIQGKVIVTMDGDTVIVLHNNRQVRVRLSGIDAPEKGQAFGQNAKNALGNAVHAKFVEVLVMGHDSYGRTLGVIMLGKTNINLEMVRHGMAWHYASFNDDATLANAQREAQAAKRGLWSEANPVPPGKWRKLNK